MQNNKADGMKRFSVHLSTELLDSVMRTERRTGKSASVVLNELLRERLNQHQKNAERTSEPTHA